MRKIIITVLSMAIVALALWVVPNVTLDSNAIIDTLLRHKNLLV
ncbi:hypothetical protein [Desulforamulus reducens]|nr:hypothetical protein [Desulforamulus reducens]